MSATEEHEAKSTADISKKRESSQEGDADASGIGNPSEERTKRFRLRHQSSPLDEHDDVKSEEVTKNSFPPRVQPPPPNKRDATSWDLETAMHRLVNESDTAKEFLSENSSVSFRVGKADDAAVIATWYREMEHAKKGKAAGGTTATNEDVIGENDKSDSLDLWLQEGFGDERTPPCVFALLADVHIKGEPDSSRAVLGDLSDMTRVAVDEVVTLGACALVTLAWEHSQRLLRIEWFHVDPTIANGEILSRRLWLRLAALALITACQLMVVDAAKVTNCSNTEES